MSLPTLHRRLSLTATRGITTPFSCSPTPAWAKVTSLKRLAEIDADTYLVSHGREGVLDGDPAHIERYLDVIYHREEKLLNFLASGPKTIEAITEHGIIYGGHTLASGAWDLSVSEMAMMIKHVERLEHLGRVAKEEGRYHLIS